MAKPSAPFGPAVFVGAARNNARFLPAALERWELLAPLFESSRFVLAENDSTDGTAEIAARWARAGDHRTVLALDGLAATEPTRPARLAAVRNRLLDEVRATTFAGEQFLVAMDMDDASLAITPQRLRRAMAFEGWDALFANQLCYYNDVWALRDPVRSPDDWTHHVNHLPPGPRRWLARLQHLTWRNRPIAPWRPPFAVSSAFGGFGIYRLPLALAGRYEGFRDGREICEHVPFNEQLEAAGARLYVHPGLINMLPLPLYRLGRIAGLL